MAKCRTPGFLLVGGGAKPHGGVGAQAGEGGGDGGAEGAALPLLKPLDYDHRKRLSKHGENLTVTDFILLWVSGIKQIRVSHTGALDAAEWSIDDKWKPFLIV